MLAKGFIKDAEAEPEIAGFEFYLDAFRELNTSRPVGLGLGPIPFTAAHSYFTIYELDMDFDEFLYVMRRLDMAFLELNSEDQDKKKGNKSNASSSTKKSS